jgi:choline dehydrogenase-like flavoprotein
MQEPYDYDFVVIGSGFGGSVSALRLTEKGYRVAVVEMGRGWGPDNMPRTTWSLRTWLCRPQLGLNGFFSMRNFRHVVVQHGNAAGGGSIAYGNTLMGPPDHVWNQGAWAGKRLPPFIPQANDFARRAAFATGGFTTTSTSEILFNIPTTAHCMRSRHDARARTGCATARTGSLDTLTCISATARCWGRTAASIQACPSPP